MPEWLLCTSCCSRWRHSSEQENLGWSHSIGIKLCARELGSHMASWDLRPGLVVYTWECMSPGSCCNRDLENKRIVAWPDLTTWFFLSPLSSPSLFLFSHALNKTKHIKWQLYGIKENKSSRDKAKQKSLFLFFFCCFKWGNLPVYFLYYSACCFREGLYFIHLKFSGHKGCNTSIIMCKLKPIQHWNELYNSN